MSYLTKYQHPLNFKDSFNVRHNMRLILLFISMFLYMAFSHSESINPTPKADAKYSPMVLGVPNFKPYTYEKNGSVVGTAISPVSDALKAIKVPHTIKLYATYSLLLKALKKNEIQGFFLASQNKERDRYATFTNTITLNSWSWVFLKNKKENPSDNDFKHSAKIGTIKGTNTYRWLVRHGYDAHGYDADELPLLLSQKKIDAVFAAQTVFRYSTVNAGLSNSAFAFEVESSKPFAMYVSKKYQQANPDFLSQLNKHILMH